MTGTVRQIDIAAGQGMPCLDPKRGTEVTRIYLRPMPFLVAEHFNPKAGKELTIKRYPLQDWIVASEVTFVAEKRTIKFRTSSGCPDF